MARRRWTEEDKQFLRDNYQKLTNKELAEHFNLTPGGIGYQLKRLNLKRNRKWTSDKDSYLKNSYTKMINKDLAQELGISCLGDHNDVLGPSRGLPAMDRSRIGLRLDDLASNLLWSGHDRELAGSGIL